MALLFKDKWARKLGLQLLEVVVSVVAHLVSDPDNHQLEFVDLGDWLGCGGLLRSCLLGVEACGLGVGGVFFGELALLLRLLHGSVDHGKVCLGWVY